MAKPTGLKQIHSNVQPLSEAITKVNVYNWAYLIFFIILPITYVGNLIDPVLIPRQLFLSVFLLPLIIYTVYSEKEALKSGEKRSAGFAYLKNKAILSFIIFFILYLVSNLYAHTISESLYVSSKVGIETVFLLLTTYLIYSRKLSLIAVTEGVILMMAITCVITLLQLFQLFFSEAEFFQKIYSINATNGHKNLLSSFLFLGIPFVFIGITRQGFWMVLSAIILTLIVLFTCLLQTRAVMLGLVVFLAVSMLVYFLLPARKNFGFWLRNIFVKRRLLISCLLCVFIALGTFSIWYINKKGSSTHLADTSQTSEANELTPLTNTNSIKARYIIWTKTLNIIKYHAWGVGAGNWQIYFPAEGLKELEHVESDDVGTGMRHFQRPHNDLLWIASETGLAGILAYLFVFGFTLSNLFKHLRKQELNTQFLFSFLCIGALCGYLAISFSDFPFERIEHQLLVLLMIAFAVQAGEKKITISPSRFLFLLCPVVFSIIVSIYRLIGEWHTHNLIVAQHKEEWGMMKREGGKSLSVFYTMDPMSTPINWYMGVADFEMNDQAAAKTNFLKAYKIHPNHVHVLNNLATCYEKSGDHASAIEYYKKALQISPVFLEAKLNLCGAYYNTGDFENAFLLIDTYPPDTLDQKYMQFLKAILASKMKTLLAQWNLQEKFILQKGNIDYFSTLYLESKTKKVNFEEYLQNI